MRTSTYRRRGLMEPTTSGLSSDWSIIPAVAEDGSLFPVDKMAAHRSGALHLAVSVFIFDGDEMLIQRRAAHKYHCGGLWANTCCTHPHWGETLGDAAERRTFEELGIRIGLTSAGGLTYQAPVTQGLIEHEKVQAFRGLARRSALCVAPDPDEVSDTRWLSFGALSAEIAVRPQDFAPWFKIYVKRWDELGLNGLH